MTQSPIKFIENPNISGKQDKYITLELSLDKIIKSWRKSLFSFEWILPDGKVRTPNEMTEDIKLKYTYALQFVQENRPIPMPILGIGVMDNVEIGSGREFVLMLYTQKAKILYAHVPINDEKEFTGYLYK